MVFFSKWPILYLAGYYNEVKRTHGPPGGMLVHQGREYGRPFSSTFFTFTAAFSYENINADVQESMCGC